jgi:uncharacterized membrane protein
MRARAAMRLLLAIVIGLALAFAPAAAHKKKHHEEQTELNNDVSASSANSAAMEPGTATAAHGGMGEMMEPEKEDRSSMSLSERLLDFLGRLHPIIVHFPIAFFPAALFTAVIGRRRPAFAAPVQFLVLAGGIIAPLAALFGWFDGGFELASDDWLLQFHRWLGTGVGLGAAGLAIWAWRKPEAYRGAAMIGGLTVITIAIIIQGWFGGAMVHGLDHMNW